MHFVLQQALELADALLGGLKGSGGVLDDLNRRVAHQACHVVGDVRGEVELLALLHRAVPEEDSGLSVLAQGEDAADAAILSDSKSFIETFDRTHLSRS